MKYKDFADFLLRQMQRWETAQGKRTTIQGFAHHLEISQPLMSIWLKGNTRPSDEKIELLAAKLGNEVYDALGMTRPDPDLQRLNQIWEHIPENVRRSIVKQGEQYVTGNKHEAPKRARRPL